MCSSDLYPCARALSTQPFRVTYFTVPVSDRICRRHSPRSEHCAPLLALFPRAGLRPAARLRRPVLPPFGRRRLRRYRALRRLWGPHPTAAKPKVAPSPSEMRCARVVSSVVACRVRCEWQSENYELDKNAQKLLDKARISVQEWLMHRFGSSR